MQAKKKYQRPKTDVINLGPVTPLLTMSIGETTNINVITVESYDAEDALIKEDPFEFDWE
jgi:DNA-directed RNA polymerase beta subunit